MKRRILLILLLLAVFSAGCGRTAEEASPTYSIYYLSEQVDRVQALTS